MRKKVHARNLGLTAAITVALLVLLVLSSVIFYFYMDRGYVHSQPIQNVSPSAASSVLPLTPSLTPSPLFYDDFTGPNKGWYLNNTAGYMRMLMNDSLVLSDANHNVLIESLPTDTTFSNFILTVVFTIDKADWDNSVGVYVRGDSNLDHDYRVDIYGNSSYSVSKEYLDAGKDQQSVFLAGPAQTDFLNPIGQQNVLTVIMNGPTLLLRINGFTVISLSDADYTQGQIALFVQGSPSSDQVAASFSSVAVYPMSDQSSSSEKIMPQKAACQAAQKYAPRRSEFAPSPAR